MDSQEEHKAYSNRQDIIRAITPKRVGTTSIPHGGHFIQFTSEFQGVREYKYGKKVRKQGAIFGVLSASESTIKKPTQVETLLGLSWTAIKSLDAYLCSSASKRQTLKGRIFKLVNNMNKEYIWTELRL